MGWGFLRWVTEALLENPIGKLGAIHLLLEPEPGALVSHFMNG